MTKLNAVLRLLVASCLLSVGLSAWGAIETYQFKDEAAREQFLHLTEELRCPKCQNQNLADSNAPIAHDMRDKIYEMVQDGASSESVVAFMVARYGDFVNYRPRRDSSTALLWYGPLALLAIGLLVVVLVSRRRARNQGATQPEHEVDQERLRKLLQDNDKA